MNKYFCDICNKEIGHKRHVMFLEINQESVKRKYELCRQCEHEIYSYIENKRIEKQEVEE